MRTSQASLWVILLLLVMALGYTLFVTRPSQSDIDAQLATLSSGSESPIDTSILNTAEVKAVGDLHVFGTRPVDPSPDAVSRRNPFEGL